MSTHILINKGTKVSILGDAIKLELEDNFLLLSFPDLETIEAMESNLGLMAIAKRTEQTMKEGVENGNHPDGDYSYMCSNPYCKCKS